MLKEVEFSHVLEAKDRISPYITKTPLEKSLHLSDDTTSLFLKMECLHKVKSFKIRGALNKILSLSDEEKEKGIITISSGNHGIAVSYAGTLTGVKNSKVIVPTITPRAKVNQIKHYGAEVMEVGNNYDEAHSFGEEYISNNNMSFVDAYDKDYVVYAGQGTCGYEIIDENPEIDVILVQIGGGGLATGVAVGAKGLKKNVQVIGVQTEACIAMVDSIKDNKAYLEYPSKESICEALTGGIGELAFQMHEKVYDEILVVTEQNIRKATAHMTLNERCVAEASGAATVAAFLQYRDKFEGKNVAAIISGGNIDGTLLKELITEYNI